jgi:hypothetical protein
MRPAQAKARGPIWKTKEQSKSKRARAQMVQHLLRPQVKSLVLPKSISCG